jgi:hypothetical protein
MKIRPDGSDRTLIAKLPLSPRFIDWCSRPRTSLHGAHQRSGTAGVASWIRKRAVVAASFYSSYAVAETVSWIC